MKKLLLGASMVALSMGANAQLATGSIAPNFTTTDINGTTHTLYDYLDQGKSVIIDISATWCGPCWNYHQNGLMENLYNGVGPGGTGDAVVLWVEGDGNTNGADIDGTGTNTQGDWTTHNGTAVQYPIIDDAAIAQAYQIGYYPTFFVICPNRIVNLVSSPSQAAIEALVNACPSASGANNPALLAYTGGTESCGGAVDMSVTLQNMGTANLTAATITVTDGGTVVLTENWTGDLPTYGTESVSLGTVSPSATTNYAIAITSPDDDASNNALTQTVSIASTITTSNVIVEIVTDAYGSETTWTLKDASGTTVASGGPYGDLGAAGETIQDPVGATLTADECYTFEILDSYGDGIAGGYGNGSWTLKDGNGTVFASGADFTDSETALFKAGSVFVASVEENIIENVNVYPNPATDVLNVSFEANNSDYTVALTDLSGRTMVSNTLSSLSGAQSLALPVADLANGNYILTISSEEGSYTQKVVIK